MLTMILYPPSAGGNHLKNILCLDPSFANSGDLDINKVYYQNPGVNIGEVQSMPGRNVHKVLIEKFLSKPDKDYVLQCHFGEIAPYQSNIFQIQKRVLLITIDQDDDQSLLNKRQHKLGQHIHPYWLKEELPYLYQSAMCEKYFGFEKTEIMSIPMIKFWQKEINNLVNDINLFLDKKIPQNLAQNLHARWHQINPGLLDQ